MWHISIPSINVSGAKIPVKKIRFSKTFVTIADHVSYTLRFQERTEAAYHRALKVWLG